MVGQISEETHRLENKTGAPLPRFPERLATLSSRYGPLSGSLLVTRRSLAALAVLFLIGWAATGVYRVQPDEQGVILRLGKWVDTTGPGLHFHLPYPFEAALLPKTTQISQLNLTRASPDATGGRNQMLTGDENLVEADCVISWKIKSAGQYLFKVYEPEKMLRLAAESAVRDVVARNPIQSALSDHRQQIADEIAAVLQQRLDSYEAGILITQVQLQRVDPPLAVIDAFNDVQRARADQERARNEAEAYRNDILPRARGEADRIIQEAEAAKTQAIELAQGEVKSFQALYDSYRKSPAVTAWRLYLDSVDELLKKSPRVIIDAAGKGAPGITPILPLSETKPGSLPQGAQK
ncbi:MAG: FtsH protease activity modulator HflK [Methylobacteriaceae bacterium]|nr:FtsH protease activity modulator HflK [Methylobacteriaceae bacterium]MBV9635806.1 FtsH protease activity modulator HflK [Methylobacteriaceae bacterium]MBV9704410.1 FtsH protease activity modulator HflK [Methylobacteriaceae bacterium]